MTRVYVKNADTVKIIYIVVHALVMFVIENRIGVFVKNVAFAIKRRQNVCASLVQMSVVLKIVFVDFMLIDANEGLSFEI